MTDYTTAEELAEELEERDRVRKVHIHNENSVSFDVKEKSHLFDFPGHIGWFVVNMTHYDGECIHFNMVFIV